MKFLFQDRREAGRELAKKLERYKNAHAVVLALPRGGVVVGAEVAKALDLPLDIVVTRKIGHPHNPEYAIGAVDAEGHTRFNKDEKARVDSAWLSEEVKREQEEAKRRLDLYRGGAEPITLEGKTAILVDDGVATGLTMRLALESVRGAGPARVVVATPVMPPDVADALRNESDELVCLIDPADFAGAIGAHYERFPQTSDTEVMHLITSQGV